MMKMSLILFAFFVCSFVLGLVSSETLNCDLELDGTCREELKANSSAPIVECGIYMAPSSLGENSNMGMFTGTSFSKGMVLQSEIAIPLVFREWGKHRPGFVDGSLWERYIWEGVVAQLDPFQDLKRDDSRAAFVPGIGCTINSIADMNNIESTSGSVWNTAGLHRSRDPGAGANCPYHFSNTTASIDIPAGAEIFAMYADSWIEQIPGAQITLNAQLKKAEAFLRDEYWPWIQSHNASLTDDFKQALWQLTSKDFPIYSKAFSVLPQVPWKQVEEALQEKSTRSVVRKFIRQQSVRTIDWLNTNGYCQDHLRPEKSTIHGAGFGAFANRALPKGSVIGYSPLIHMGMYGRDIYWVTYPEEVDRIERKQKKRYDLIINYSFGHSNSSVLLTPYGGMINYINHDKERANVKIRWPSKELVAHKPWWLEKTPEQLRDTTEKIGLSFEYVALHDIAQDEEIFMDYGPEWEAAWKNHVNNWIPPTDSADYIHRTEWPEQYIRTTEEDPYPDNFVVVCVNSFITSQEGETNTWVDTLVNDDRKRVYCRALERVEGEDSNDVKEFTYTVELELKDDDGAVNLVVVQDVPDTGIALVDRAYSQDWHLEGVFRHEIMIPDDVFPPAWLNGPPKHPSENDDDLTQFPVDMTID